MSRDDHEERRRQEREREQRRQAEVREWTHRQRSLCISCGLIQATYGPYCSMCAPQTAREPAAVAEPRPWPDRPPEDPTSPGGSPFEEPLDPAGRPDRDYHERLATALANEMPVEKHHLFPREFAARFAGRVDIHEHTVPIPKDWHTELHASWNLEWRDFFVRHRTPSRAEIEEQAARMMEDHGFLEALMVRFGTEIYERAPRKKRR